MANSKLTPHETLSQDIFAIARARARLVAPVAEPCPLRPYQARAIELARESIAAGKRRPVLQLPTGAGKTRIAAEIIRRALAKGNPGIFVVPRISLIEQTVAAFQREGIGHIGVIQGRNYRTNPAAPVQIASAQTLIRREIPHAGIVIIDECHLQFDSISKWIGSPDWKHVPFIGLSATPWSRGLGKIYDDLLRPVSIDDLIEDGFLSRFRVFAPPEPDLAGVRTTAGEFNEADLSDACDRKEIVADIVKTWFEKGEGRSTLCYGVDRRHAKHLQERFIEAGVSTEYVDCDSPLCEREEIFERFRSSDTRIICNVATLDTGIDLDVRCVIDARPTKSRIRFVQTIGRGLRVVEGKDHCIILDHAGNHQRLGLVTNIDCAELDGGGRARSFDRASADRAPHMPVCKVCTFVLPRRARLCLACGEPILAVTPIIEKAGELVALGSDKRGATPKADEALWHGALARIACQKGYKLGWAAYKFREKFGHFPAALFPVEREPTVSILNWVRSRQIAYAKARQYG